jgi:hypothetical protein
MPGQFLLLTGPMSVLFGLPSKANSRATSEPTPRGNRPVVRLAIARAWPQSRSSRNFRAISPSASSQEIAVNVDSGEPFSPRHGEAAL